MRIFDEPADVIRMLQGPPTETELAGEDAAVDQMVAARARSVAPPRRRRPYRLGAMVAAGVIGFGGVAAASPGGFDLLDLAPEDPAPIEPVDGQVDGDPSNGDDVNGDDLNGDDLNGDDTNDGSPEDEVDKVEVVEEADEELPAIAEVEPSDEPLFDDNEATAFNEEFCLPGPHGATVSAVAKGADFDGASVVDAAHSDCGKKTLMPYSGDSESESKDGEDPEVVEETPEPVQESSDVEQESVQPGGKQTGKGKADKASKGNQGKAKGKGARGGD